MVRYIVRRLIGSLPVLFLTSILIYGILLIAPGGPTARFAQNPRITAELGPGTHRVWVGPFSENTGGSFSLEISRGVRLTLRPILE